MTYAEYKSLRNIGSQPKVRDYWQKIEYELAQRADRDYPLLGGFTIRSSWRPQSGAGATRSRHKYTPALALDIRPLGVSLWGAYQILKSRGWKVIGIDPGQNILHIDLAYERGLTPYPYYFYEIGGKDIGPLSQRTLSQLRAIPGYGSTITQTSYPQGYIKVAEKQLHPLALAAFPLLFITFRRLRA